MSSYLLNIDPIPQKVCNQDKVLLQIPWIEKYRPQNINDIMSHSIIIDSLKKFIANGTLPHMLFFGPPGTGKTSTIMCCAKEIYGEYEECMILRLNASNERGIDTVRTKIRNFVSNRCGTFLPTDMTKLYKLVILDEIDSMTVDAQGMLRKSIENNSETTRFCLICNNIDKINPALQSRCASFHFSPLDFNSTYNKLSEICKIEKLKTDKNILSAIISLSNGDMRTSINILQSCKMMNNDDIQINDIYKISGYCLPSVIDTVFKKIMYLHNNKESLETTIKQLIEIISNNNLTMYNLLDNLKKKIIDSSYLDNIKKIFLIDNFAKIEVYDSVNIDQNNTIMILCSLFVLIKKIDIIDGF